MPVSSLDRIMKFLRSSGIDELRILGGEPSLHPDFLSFIRKGLAEEFNIRIFSNGLMKEEIIDQIVGLDGDRIKFIINSIDPADNLHEHQLQEKSLSKLGDRAVLGINIHHPGQTLDYLIPMIEKYNLAPEIRLGLAHPTVPPSNQYLHPKFYRSVGNRLAALYDEASEKNIRFSFDCGFVPCMFPEDLQDTFKDEFGELGQRCNPVLDILPDGQIISCFPLHALEQVELSDSQTAQTVREVFIKTWEPFGSTGIYPHCIRCELFESKECLGGCRAHVINRFEGRASEQSGDRAGHHDVKAISPFGLENKNERSQESVANQKEKANLDKWIIPYVDQPPEFWDKIHERYAGNVKSVYFPMTGHSTGSGRPIQPAAYLTSFLNSVKFSKTLTINPIILPDRIENIGKKILEEIGSVVNTHKVREITLASASLAELIKKEYPDISLAASTLMDIHSPIQLTMLEGLFDTIVPSGKILRNREALQTLRNSFKGKIRLLVNEACIPGCVYRTQHFYEMGPLAVDHPESLCNEMLARHPWLRLTGAWILPQFLDLYEGLFDELKLAGRITLQNPEKYMHVLSHYMERRDLMPYEIGGGPASPPPSVNIEKEFFKYTLDCSNNCADCSYCMEYWAVQNPDEKNDTLLDEKSPSGKKKEHQKSEKFDHLLRNNEGNLPAEIDLEKIRIDWKKIPKEYSYKEKEMPSPEWKEHGLLHTQTECWDILKEKTDVHSSRPISVYVHVPFCDRRCNFCDCQSTFVSKRNLELQEKFTQLLLAEIIQWATLPSIPDRQVTTIHFGGGTPNYLPLENLARIIYRLRKELNVSNHTELALESTTTLLSKEHLQALSEIGFRRLHVGVQTLNDPIRKSLGRRDKADEVLEKLETALQMGFVVSVDIIYGLPGQRADSLLKTLSRLSECGIHGYSLYHLNITDQNRRFFDKLKGFERDILHDYFLFQVADQYLIQQGYKKNHFVHYAREVDENLYYNHVKRDEDLLALGPTADGFFDDYYYINKWIEEYMSHDQSEYPPLNGGNLISREEFKLRPLKAQLMCSTVTDSLVNKLDQGKLFDRWQRSGLIQKLNGKYRLSGTGSWFINQMVTELMRNGI